LNTLHRLGPWLFGLFLTAQAVAAVPFILYAPTLHAFKSGQPLGAYDGACAVDAFDHRHRHVVLDPHDECTMHHHLIAVLTSSPSADLLDFVKLPTIARQAVQLASAEPSRLERPPKSLPLI
jgi:hypothetical protein